MDTQIEVPEVEEPVAEENDFSSLTTAEDAMNEYKSMLEDYADKVKNGETDAAKELKTKLDELKSYAEGHFEMTEIKALGINTIWLMPIYEEGILNSVNSPYCVKDYKKVSAEYGTLEDLRALTTQAHALGMSVILDWVANHTSSWLLAYSRNC